MRAVIGIRLYIRNYKISFFLKQFYIKRDVIRKPFFIEIPPHSVDDDVIFREVEQVNKSEDCITSCWQRTFVVEERANAFACF